MNDLPDKSSDKDRDRPEKRAFQPYAKISKPKLQNSLIQSDNQSESEL